MKSKELTMVNRIKHTLKVDLEKNPEFYKPLAERLEELIKRHKEGRIEQLDLLEELKKLQMTLINKSQEGEKLGFKLEREFAVYKLLEHQELADAAKPLTETLFQTLKGDLETDNWKEKPHVQSEMRGKIKKILRSAVSKDQRETLTTSIITVLKSNS